MCHFTSFTPSLQRLAGIFNELQLHYFPDVGELDGRILDVDPRGYAIVACFDGGVVRVPLYQIERGEIQRTAPDVYQCKVRRHGWN